MIDYRKREAVERLIAARNVYTYSQKEASRAINLTLAEYGEVERGERHLTFSQVQALVELFGINESNLKPLIKQE